MPNPPDEDIIFTAHQLGKKEYNEVMIYVIFTALTAEALINKYLFLQLQTGKMSPKLFKDIDEKMNTVDKWELATQYFRSSEVQVLLNRGREPMQSLAKLFKLRNKLVHSRQSRLNIAIYNSDGNLTPQNLTEKPSPYSLTFENTKRYLKTVQHLMEVLQKSGSEGISDWLNEEDWAKPIVITEE